MFVNEKLIKTDFLGSFSVSNEKCHHPKAVIMGKYHVTTVVALLLFSAPNIFTLCICQVLKLDLS